MITENTWVRNLPIFFMNNESIISPSHLNLKTSQINATEKNKCKKVTITSQFFLTEGKHQQICQGCKRVMPTVENREIMPGNLE